MPSIFEVDNSRVFTGLYMLTSGAGFLIPYMATRNASVTYAEADLSLYGQTRGILHGNLLVTTFVEDPDFSTTAFFGALMGVGEGFFGYHWAKRSQMTHGTALTIGTIADFGAGIGGAATHFTGLADHAPMQAISAGALLGSASGVLAGKWLADHYEYTPGDAYMLSGAGFAGAYLSFAATYLAQPDDDKFYSALATIGGLGGLAAGHTIAKTNNYTSSQGIYINLGELAGGLFGLGAGYLLSSDSQHMDKTLIASSALGAAGGFSLMTYIYANRSEKNKEKQALKLNLHPHGLLGFTKKANTQQDRYHSPLLGLSYRF